MDGDVNINFSDRDGDILDFQASHQFEEWHGIKRIALCPMELDLDLFQLTCDDYNSYERK